MSLDNSENERKRSATDLRHDGESLVDSSGVTSAGNAADGGPGGTAREAGEIGPVIGEAMGREDLEYRIAELEGEVEQLRDQLLRRQAELINYRKRVQRERAEVGAVAQAGVMERLLPVIDDFERAVAADAEDVEAYRAGVELILKSMESLLSSLSVERLDPLHEEFDPEVHEAIARVETEEAPGGQVVEVYLPGYRMGERLLRPARVAVAVQPSVDARQGDAAAGESRNPDV